MMYFFDNLKSAQDACDSIPSLDGDVSYAGSAPFVEYKPKPYCLPIQGADGWYVVSDSHTDKYLSGEKRKFSPIEEE